MKEIKDFIKFYLFSYFIYFIIAMNKHWVRFYLAGAIWGLLASCAEKKVTLVEYTFEAQPVDLKIDSVTDGYRVEGSSAFQLPGCEIYI